MKKTLVILAAVAILGVIASYVKPAGSEKTPTTAKTSTPQQTTTTASNTPSTGSTNSTATLKDGTFVGETASSQYGDLAISLNIQNGKIVAVSTSKLTYYDGHSQQIDSYAIPELKQQTLAAQSGSIDGVSGATFTSNSYMQSLQSALDQAKI